MAGQRASVLRPDTDPKPASAGDLSYSSTLLDPASSSTFRARLGTPDTAAHVEQDPAPAPPGLYQRFRACFAKPAVPQSNSAQGPGEGDNGEDGLVAQLREAFAEAGVHNYNSAVKDILDARATLVSLIDALSEQSGVISSSAQVVRANLRPLSATLCHGENLPKATIASHLFTTLGNLENTHEQLKELQDEWRSCAADQRQAWTELFGKIENAAPHLDDGVPDALKREFKTFKEDLNELVRRFEDLLDGIDAEYRELMQSETMTMMQSIMAG